MTDKHMIPVLADYLTMLIRTFMTSISREYISDPYWRNTVVVETGDISPIEFAMTVAQKEDLFRCGFDTASSVIPLKLESLPMALPAQASV